ncbi:ATP-binding protein [Actinoplanes sp. NBRC 101535]|uniref:sensor histidine kinase n=1 Tax=Actinoplanes sp. NBRC 101535 TaxID=3032196 RepID=UPI0024A59168|nr:ATP-binding protein [Actinoplanes sp. NBRC 101535]GLY05751.1 hypothetical protein Acsp01_61300 [Actinoplanes sp. NBRC 101535]
MTVRSIRARLTITLSASAAAVIALSFAASVALISAFLHHRDAGQLRSVAARLEIGFTAIGATVIDERALRDPTANSVHTMLVTTAGPVGADGLDAGALTGLATAGPAEPVTVADRYLALGIDMRDRGLRYRAPDGVETPALRIVVFLDTADRRQTTLGIVTVIAGASTVAVAVFILLAVLIVGRGLAPLPAMAERAERVAAGDRTRRLPLGRGDPAIERLARTVNAAFDAQQDAEHRMRAFIADASHELRNPLTAATGWVELYLNGGLSDEGRLTDALQRVDNDLGRMRQLVDELALLARTDAGRPLEQQPVDLRAVAEDVVADLRVIAPDRRIRLEAESAVVLGDHARLSQALRNLVGNAVQHTPPDATITVTVGGSTGEHRIQVADTGPGIPPEHLPHLFERFWRGDPARTAPGGSGLGLSIVQSIATAHGGSIRVATGAGTVFTLTLPAFRHAEQVSAGGPGADP